jgi:F-type H+-transporting ATPase subunit b
MLSIVRAAAEDPVRFVLPHSDELIWGTLAFLILFTVLAKVAFPSIRKVLVQRAEKIRSGLESAEKSKSDADALLDQYRQQLSEARGEANKIIEEGKRTAEALRRDLVARAEGDAQDIVARARAEVSSERDRALAELRSTIGDLSVQLATRVIQRELANEPAQRAYIDQTIAELSALGDGKTS